MKRSELIQALQDEQRVDDFDQEVLIVTDKQLLPNAKYEFELDVENGADGPIVLRPTIRSSNVRLSE
jgi:hypothetical protein